MAVDTPEQHVETQSLEAVAELKKGSDLIDPLHIYKINSESDEQSTGLCNEIILQDLKSSTTRWIKMERKILYNRKMHSLTDVIVNVPDSYH